MLILVSPVVTFWLLALVGMAILFPLARASSQSALFKWAVAQWLVMGANLVWTGAWWWFLRDGLGTDAIQSHGRAAIARFMDQFGFVALVVGIEVVMGLSCYFWRRSRLLRVAS